MKKKMLSLIMTAVMSTAFIGQTVLSVPFNADAISEQVQSKIANSDVTTDYVQVDDYGLFKNYVVQEHITFARNDGKKFRIFYEVNENIYYGEVDTVPAFSFKGSAKDFAIEYLTENNLEYEISDIDMTGVDSIYQSAYADGFTIVFADSVPLSERVKATADISASVKDNKGLPVFMSISTAYANLVQNSNIRNANDEVFKNYSYFKALSNTQLYEEYKQYREKTERPLETYVTDEGIIKNDYVKVNAKYIKKGIFGVNGFNIEPLESVMIEKNITAQPDYITNEEYLAKHEYLGFDSGYQGEFDIYLSDMGETVRINPIEALAADTNGTEDTKQAEEVIYECMRCELTIYNSQFFGKYRSECGLVMAGGVLPGKAKEYEEKIGDANVDGEVGLADALTILQFIANSQKYPMYEEGYEVADIVGDDDGVTPLDALEIQKWDSQKKLS